MSLLTCQACAEVFTLVLLVLAGEGTALVCYNGTVTSLRFGDDPLTSNGYFGRGGLARLRCSMTIRCEEHAMCFVRSWSARGKHAWLVQRGCYKSSPDDPLPRTVRSPTRSMSCKRERYKDAEYKVCLCQADWCNRATSYLDSWLHAGTFMGVVHSIVLPCLYLS